MASSLLALLDDITLVLDDIAVLTKVATKKTAGVLGDDLALNAEQVSGVRADRELPVVWAVAKGSALNKAILVPIALLLSAFAKFLIIPLLMIGGIFLCFEGMEKIAHKFLHSKEDDAAQAKLHEAVVNDEIDLVALEKQKIKGAIRTDFILSAEIIVITLGTVATASFSKQVSVLVLISVLMTVGVYSLVAGIVKLDDIGLHLMRKPGASGFSMALGRALVKYTPYLMKLLSIVGTAAMFLVGGGIIVHNWPWLHHLIEAFAPPNSGALAWTLGTVAEGVAGMIAGTIALLGFKGVMKLKS
jgi:uncharacterized protein